ncbi:ketose-bisphosphate aldolase [Microlunatus soli]|uniref:Fructose-bisphosphate aldolase, class II n=1 Tax=Microlunatus soli TaxID=630515 RepID=A0A1H1YD41_9ACTN|nr:ketose-bisphosphate aldolase [Microlunatus soli]SDT19199.1 fructose-bisphosphate aldolase, class II [Microlunatus soli]
MLTTGKAILDVANEHNFAVPAFNISDYAMFNGIVDVSEELDAPLIVAIHPSEVAHIGPDVNAAIAQRAHRSSVPIAVHWDHGASYAEIITAIKTGFTSVMIDGSMLPFEDNIAVSSKVVEAAHAVGVSVEAELGTIGQTDTQAEAGTSSIIYTDPTDAVDFVKRSGVDSLAVAIGTYHGIYPSTLKPELKLDLLREIKERVELPLVLHGGSNNPDDEIGQAVKLGINKINISSDIKVAYHDALREVLKDPALREPNVIQPAAVQAMKVVAAQKISLFDAAGRGALY